MKFSKVLFLAPGIPTNSTARETLFLTEPGNGTKHGWTLTGNATGVMLQKPKIGSFFVPWSRVEVAEVVAEAPAAAPPKKVA